MQRISEESDMSVIHVQQIKGQLVNLFKNLIDVSDYDNRPPADKESAFLSRSLGAFAVMSTADISPDAAAACVTDGGQDNGIDAIYFDGVEKILYLCQSKWKHDGKGTIERGEAQKFIQGTKDIVTARFNRFNAKISDRAGEIMSALYSANTRFVLLIVYSGQESLAPEVQRDFDDFLLEMNDAGDVVQLRVLRQSNLHGIIASGTLGAPINLDIVLRDWGQVREPYLAYFGQVAAQDVAGWWDAHHPRLFAPNIRSFLGQTEINQSIIETLCEAPENFWYFNNGITALCSMIKKKPLGGPGHETGIFECTDVRIVNGAQTAGAIASASAKRPDKMNAASVMVRFISLEQCPEGFSTAVTRATNTQNKIEGRDFVSLDPEQERLRTELQIDGIDYVYKSGDTPRDPKSGFDLLEATIALACSHRDLTLAVQAKREISKLWEDIAKAPYKALFNSSLPGRILWNMVQLLRLIDQEFSIQLGLRPSKDKMVLVHGNRFLERQIFRRLKLQQLDAHTNVSTVQAEVSSLVPLATELTIILINKEYPDSYLASLFKNKTKCTKMESELDKEIPVFKA
jgi:hypothetical protein